MYLLNVHQGELYVFALIFIYGVIMRELLLKSVI